MNCQECHDHIIDYLYEELDDATLAAFERALEACPECRDEVAELRQTLLTFDRLPTISLPEARREAILEAARSAIEAPAAVAQRSGSESGHTKAATVVPFYRRPLFGVAMAALFSGAILSAILLYRPADERGASDTEYPTAVAQTDDIAADEDMVTMARLGESEEMAARPSARSSASAADRSARQEQGSEGAGPGRVGTLGGLAGAREGAGSRSYGMAGGAAEEAEPIPEEARDDDGSAAVARRADEPAPRLELSASANRGRAQARSSASAPSASAGALADEAPVLAEEAREAEPVAISALADAERDETEDSVAQGSATGAAGGALAEADSAEQEAPARPAPSLNERADSAFDDARYGEAQTLYEELFRRSSGEVAERALYRAALSASRSGDARSARELATAYIERFPDGRYADEARALID